MGRILGDIIREQEGVAVYALIEQVRQLSVAFRRDHDHEADQALKSLLKGLSTDQTVSVIRAFTYFSAPGQFGRRPPPHPPPRQCMSARADTQEGSIEVALSRLRWAGITPDTIANTLARAYVAPVLTAHPTEVQRQSILQAERDIARLLAERDDIAARAQLFDSAKDALTPRELAANEAQLRARVAQLWQTRLLRYSKLTVADEIENALSYYESTFLHEAAQALRRAWKKRLRRPKQSTAFCAWGSGLAATAMATPTSPRTRWSWRCAAKARWRCATT